jgi:DNA-binding Lrp family transcriptional regulator
MDKMNLSSIDRKLFGLLQVEFPLTRHPYADLGSGLGIGEQEAIKRIGQLKAAGIIRQIGPVLDARSLGFKTTLVAMKVPEKQIDKAAPLIVKHPGISHGYERGHYYNLWFTMAVPARGDMEAEIAGLAELIKAEAFFELPAVRLFKLRVHFALEGDRQTGADNHHARVRQRAARLSPADRMVINELQQDLPLVARPFADMAQRLSMDEDDFLSRCRSVLQRGIMRRFSAAVNHRTVGFTANGMACWIAPPEKVAALGQKLASLRQVSHCYERKTNPLWRYNLFAMIHARTGEECRQVAAMVSAEADLADYVMLFSTREFKKTRVKYLV